MTVINVIAVARGFWAVKGESRVPMQLRPGQVYELDLGTCPTDIDGNAVLPLCFVPAGHAETARRMRLFNNSGSLEPKLEHIIVTP